MLPLCTLSLASLMSCEAERRARIRLTQQESPRDDYLIFTSYPPPLPLEHRGVEDAALAYAGTVLVHVGCNCCSARG